MFPEPGVDYLPSSMYQLNEVNSNTGSHRSMQYIAAQVQDCRATHESCGRSSGSIGYPRRLLQVLSAWALRSNLRRDPCLARQAIDPLSTSDIS